MFLLDLRRIVRGTRHADDHSIAQSEALVVPPAWLDRPETQPSPLRELIAHQAAHEVFVDDW